MAERIAVEVQKNRVRRGMSAQELSDACARLGLTFSRSAIANFESGRRPTISVTELLVVARALGVPPVLLVYPLGRPAGETVEALPGEALDAWEAVKWFTGKQSFPRQDENGHWYTDQEDYSSWEVSAAVLENFRVHEEYVTEWNNVLRRADARRAVAKRTTNPRESEENLERAAQDDSRVRSIEKELTRLRAAMRSQGFSPPRLDPLLAHIDDTR